MSSEYSSLTDSDHEQPVLLRKRNLFCGGRVQCVFETIAVFFFLIAFIYFGIFGFSVILFFDDYDCRGYFGNIYSAFLTLGPLLYISFFGVAAGYCSRMTRQPSRVWMILIILQCPLIILLAYSPDFSLFDTPVYMCMRVVPDLTQYLLIPAFLANSLCCVFCLHRTSLLRGDAEWQKDEEDLYEVDA